MAEEKHAHKVEKETKKESSSAVKEAIKKAVKKVEVKTEVIELEREYIIPLRKEFLKVPRYKRAKRAVKTIKEFLAKHMKVADRDTKLVKVNIYLNNEVWFKGIKKPMTKIKVKAIKKGGVVYAELAEVPEAVQYKMNKDAKKYKKVDEKAVKAVAKQEEGEEELKESREDHSNEAEESEDKKSVVEAGLKENKAEAKEIKHTEKAPDDKKEHMAERMHMRSLQK